MPRNVSGTYTLPAGNPVISDTFIQVDWANPTLSDIAQALTDSLDRNGRGNMLAPFKFADGTVAAPAMAFATEPSTGFWHPGDKAIGVAVNGGEVARFTDTAVSIVGIALFPDGTIAAPGIAFASEPITGLFHVNPGVVGITVTGSELVRLESTGAKFFTNNLAIYGSNAVCVLNKTASGGESDIMGGLNGVPRWGISLGNAAAETGGNVGSDFIVYRFNDAGAIVDQPMTIRRSDGALGIGGFGTAVLLYTSGALRTQWDTSGAVTHMGAAYKPGGGVWADSSDERIKDNIADYTAGLAQVLELRPRTYTFKPGMNSDPATTHYGLVAQEAQPVMPELVGSITRDYEGAPMEMLTVDATALTYALVNAVQEVAALLEALDFRVTNLEAAT